MFLTSRVVKHIISLVITVYRVILAVTKSIHSLSWHFLWFWSPGQSSFKKRTFVWIWIRHYSFSFRLLKVKIFESETEEQTWKYFHTIYSYILYKYLFAEILHCRLVWDYSMKDFIVNLTQLLDIRCRCLESPPCPPSLLLFSLWEALGFSKSFSSILSTLWPSFQVTLLPGEQSVFGISPCFEWGEGVSAAFIVFPMSLSSSLRCHDDHLIDDNDDGLLLPICHVCLWDSGDSWH